MMNQVSRRVAFLITGAAALIVAALALMLPQPSAELGPVAPLTNGGERQSPFPPTAAVRTAGGEVVSFVDSRLTFRTPTEQREAVITSATTIAKLERADARTLRRVPGAPADLRAGASVTVTTQGNFLEPGVVTASRVEVVPVGTPFLIVQ